MLLHAGLTFAQQYNYSIRLRPPPFAAMRKEAKISSASWMLGSQRQGPTLPTLDPAGGWIADSPVILMVYLSNAGWRRCLTTGESMMDEYRQWATAPLAWGV